MPIPKRPRTCVERDYATFYAIDVGGQAGHDQVIYKHPNGLCVVCLAPSHPVMQRDWTVKDDTTALKVEFNKKDDAGAPTGKKKRGALSLQTDSVICKLETAGEVFKARCCVKGKLLEVNEKLVKHPELLGKEPRTAGYLAILMPNSGDIQAMEKTLLSVDAYQELRTQSSIEQPSVTT